MSGRKEDVEGCVVIGEWIDVYLKLYIVEGGPSKNQETPSAFHSMHTVHLMFM